MSANFFFWDIPTKILSGSGAVKEIRKPEIKGLFPGNRALMVTSAGNSLKSSGVIKEVTHIMENAEVEVAIFDGVTPNPDLSVVKEGLEILRGVSAGSGNTGSNDTQADEEQETTGPDGVDFIIALGGGSVMDVAEVMAGLANEEKEDISKFFFTGDKKPLKRTGPGLPIMKIPTTAGTGAETANTAYIVNEATGVKGEFKGDHPFLAVVDPELHVTLPYDETAFGAFTALLQGLEGYISKNRTAPAQMMHIATLGNIAQFVNAAIEDGADMDAREKIAFACTMSGMSKQLGSTTGLDAIANAVTGTFRNIPHGAVLAICCKEYFNYFLERNCCDAVFTEMAMSIGRAPLEPSEFLAGLDDLKEAAGLDELKLGDYGVGEDDLADIAAKAYAGRGEFFRNDPIPMSESDIIKLLETCL